MLTVDYACCTVHLWKNVNLKEPPSEFMEQRVAFRFDSIHRFLQTSHVRVPRVLTDLRNA